MTSMQNLIEQLNNSMPKSILNDVSNEDNSSLTINVVNAPSNLLNLVSITLQKIKIQLINKMLFY